MFGRIRAAFGGILNGYSRGAPPPVMCRKHKCRGRRDAQERPPPGDFCLGKSHQNRLAPKAADPSLRFSPASALAQLAGRAPRASGSNTGLATTPLPATLLGRRLRGEKHEAAGVLPLGPVGRARASQAFARKPDGARAWTRASAARTGRSCRPTVRQRREAQGEVTPSGFAFLLVTFLWRGKEKLPAVGQPPTSTKRARRALDKKPFELPQSSVCSCSQASLPPAPRSNTGPSPMARVFISCRRASCRWCNCARCSTPPRNAIRRTSPVWRI